MKSLFPGFTSLYLVLSLLPTIGYATPSATAKSIVILHENDVHCAIDGYAKFAGLRNAIADTAWVATVSCGDFLQGGAMGAISRGQYIVDVMKTVHYDALTIGNHEFDFRVPRMQELLPHIESSVICTNLFDHHGKQVYPSYVIRQVGDKRIAFIGVTTPSAMVTEAFAFTDATGRKQHDLKHKHIYTLVQAAVDSVRKQGVDYVIVLSHLGETMPDPCETSRGLIRATHGIDAVLDGHTHHLVQEQVPNRKGQLVYLAQTGTQFSHIGKLLISPQGKISTQLIPIEEVHALSQEVQQTIDSVKQLARQQTEEVLAYCNFELSMRNSDGSQQVRKAETNLGDLVADAFRHTASAQIGLTNGGGIRTDIAAGEIRYQDILNALPFDNALYLVETDGATLYRLLRVCTADLPKESGDFPQISGLRFTVYASRHRIKDVEVWNEQTQQYEALDNRKTYTVATTDYCLYGGGFHYCLRHAKVLRTHIAGYAEPVARYLKEYLHGRVSTPYECPQQRIRILW